jgi:hypothetical protein
MAQLPLAMLAQDNADSLLRPFFKNGFMWAGLAIPFFLIA